MEDTINIDQFLDETGFDTPGAMMRARAILESHRLTNPRKQGFTRAKLARVEDLLAASLVRVCSDTCEGLIPARPRREVVRVTQPGCEICAGSNNRRAVGRCVAALRRRKMERILVVGGAPTQQHDLVRHFEATGIELRCIDGTQASHATKDAEHNKRWAQLIVIWGPTPLRHAVSNLYTEETYPGLKVVSVSRRGIEALCGEIIKAVS